MIAILVKSALLVTVTRATSAYMSVNKITQKGGIRSFRGLETGMVKGSSTRALALHAAALNNATSAKLFLNQQAHQHNAPAGHKSGDSCMPVCTWQCTSPQCNQVCEPSCEAPRCDTRCTKKDTSACEFNCETPSCAVVCPTPGCSMNECPKCNAVCGNPKCTLSCSGYQPCHAVCEQPACKWICHKPEVCPEPKCEMVCESPKICPEAGTFKELPPAKDEIVVQSFEVPHVPQSTGGGIAGGDSGGMAGGTAEGIAVGGPALPPCPKSPCPGGAAEEVVYYEEGEGGGEGGTVYYYEDESPMPPQAPVPRGEADIRFAEGTNYPQRGRGKGKFKRKGQGRGQIPIRRSGDLRRPANQKANVVSPALPRVYPAVSPAANAALQSRH